MADVGPPSYPVSSDGYDVYSEIGSGAFATVYHGRVRSTGEEVAIKVIDLDLFNTDWQEVRREISTMALLNHPNVVSIKCSFVDHQDLWIIMPLLQAGSCAAIMKAIAPTGFKDEALLATILGFTLQGLQYLHKDGRIHRDVKAGNILIGSGGEVQLADFGVAGTLMENGDRVKNRQTFTGTPCWMAPEVMEQAAGYDEKADIWSFGITALELAYGYAPYAKFQPMKVMLLTLQEEPPTADIYRDTTYTFSKHFHSLVDKCLRKDPAKRPSARRLLEHRFFKQMKGKEVVQELIVKRMPRMKRSAEVTGIRKKKGTGGDAGGVRGGGGGGGGLGDDGVGVGGVSVGSWVFDPEEFQEMKRAIALEEEKKGRKKRPEKIIEKDGEDEEDDYRTDTPIHSPHLSPQHPSAATSAHVPLSSFAPSFLPTVPNPSSLSSSSSSASSPHSPLAPLPVNPRKQSHGRFLVTEHILEQAAPAQSSSSASVSAPLPGESVASAYAAMAAGGGPPTLTHSRVGRFAVTDEQHQ